MDEPIAHAAVGRGPAFGGVPVKLCGGRIGPLPRAAGQGERVRYGVRVGAGAEQVVEQAECEVWVEPHARGVRRGEGIGWGLGAA